MCTTLEALQGYVEFLESLPEIIRNSKDFRDRAFALRILDGDPNTTLSVIQVDTQREFLVVELAWENGYDAFESGTVDIPFEVLGIPTKSVGSAE